MEYAIEILKQKSLEARNKADWCKRTQSIEWEKMYIKRYEQIEKAISILNEATVKLREDCPSCGISHYLQDLEGIRWCQECATHWAIE